MFKKAKSIIDNRNNDTDSRIAFSILKGAVFVVVLVILTIICLVRLGTDYAVGTYINNSQIHGYDKEKNALNQTVFLEFSDTCIIAFDSNDLQGISVTLDGQTSGKHLYSSTEAYQVAQGIAEITLNDDGSFTFDANSSFEVAEVVLMTIKYNGDDGDTTQYFAFAVGESTKSSSAGTGTIDATEDETMTYVFFNGSTVTTFDSKESAISNCGSTYVSSYDITVEPNSIDRVIISTYTYDGEYHYNKDEVFIYSGNDWSAHIDLSQYAGQVVVVKVRTETTSNALEMQNRFFAIKIRESESTEESESVEVTEEVTEGSTVAE